MRRILRDLKILILANLWLVPVLAGLVGALFYFVAPPPPIHATGRYTILNAEPVRGDNGRIEIVYITAKRQSGVA